MTVGKIALGVLIGNLVNRFRRMVPADSLENGSFLPLLPDSSVAS